MERNQGKKRKQKREKKQKNLKYRVSKRVLNDDKRLAKCGKRKEAEISFRNAKLLKYQMVVQSLDVESFDENCDLKAEFLEKFNALDLHQLAIAFRDDADPPGEGANIWPLWAARNPHHTVVEWATYWHFWVAVLLRNILKNLSKKRLVVETQLPEDFLRGFTGEELRQLVILFSVIDNSPPQGPLYWNNFVQTHPNHRENDWSQLWLLWFRPMITSYKTLITSDQPVDVVRRKNSITDNRGSGLGDQVNPGIWNERGPLTVLAEKYGQSVHFYYHNSGETGNTPRRSGLTPRHNPLGYSPLTPISHAREMEYELYQANVFGTTLMELYDLEAIEKPNLRPQGLTNPIHPLFERDRWLKVEDDHWDIGADDAAWEALVPCLRLVTKFLTDCHLETWWDDLVNAAETGVAIPNTYYFRYFSRNSEARYRQKTDWSLMQRHLTLFVGDTGGQGCHAFTRMINEDPTIDELDVLDTGNPEDRFTSITLSRKSLIVLMATGPKKMTEAERLIYTYFVAVTLLHELAHAYGQVYYGTCYRVPIIDPDTGQPDFIERVEPFYENEDFAELGYSMEMAIFGGNIYNAPADPREPGLKRFKGENTNHEENLPIRCLGIGQTPTFRDFESVYGRLPTLNPEQWTVGPQSYEIGHVPLSFIEEVQQDSFWEVYTREYGGGMLKIYPMIRKVVISRDHLGDISTWNYIALDYKQLEWERLGLHLGPNDEPPHPLSVPYINTRARNASAILLRVILRQQEIQRHNRIREMTMTPEKQRQLLEFEVQRLQEHEAFEEARRAVWRAEDVQEVADENIAAIIDAIPDPQERLDVCNERIKEAAREKDDPNNEGDLRAAWNTQWISYSRVLSSLKSGSYGLSESDSDEDDDDDGDGDIEML